MGLLLMTAAGGDFEVEPRTPSMTKYPCTSCHKRDVSGAPKNPHWTIKLKHASESEMNCATCHGSARMETLVSLTGRAIDFNDSWKLCGQCHATQRKDWEAGAHGKRVSGWDRPRVIRSCTGCHDPHAPALEKRLPARREP
jgi:hypothetical protein